MSAIRKVCSKLLSPLDRYIQRRMEAYCRRLDHRIGYVEERIAGRAIEQCVPRNWLFFQVDIAAHCNLNCEFCSHFAPVADEEFLDIEEYTRDCKRLAELFNGEALVIELLGGEPLLNKEITKFMQVTRECFPRLAVGDKDNPKRGLIITTNGLLLPKMDEHFWECVRKYRVGIQITKYPIDFDYDAAIKLCNEKGAINSYINEEKDSSGKVKERTMYRCPLDLSGKQSIINSFLNCGNANTCITLEHGKIYTCSAAAHAHVLKKHFNLDIELSPDDGIDIYKARDSWQIMKFLTQPIPFCRYCNMFGIERNHPYGQSKRTLDEWAQ